jgi:hypothetical protein
MWDHQRIYFATDPVAMDKIGWEVLDKKRVEMGRLPLAEAHLDPFSSYVRMQPEHVDIAGALGLGVANREKIELVELEIS